MNLRKTFKWSLFFILLLLAAAGGTGYWFWMQSDELLRTTILTQADVMLPDADIRLGKARFDFHRRIRLYDIELKPVENQPALVTIPEIVLTIDKDLLASEQRVLVHKVTILRPTLELVRRKDGTWNWQSLWPLPKSDNSLPEFEIENGTVTLHWEPDSGVQHTSVSVQNVNMRLIPAGHREFQIVAVGQVNFSGKLSLEGQLDLNRHSWSVTGQWNDLKAGAELGQLISTIAPQFDHKLHALLAEAPTSAAHGSEPTLASDGPSKTAANAQHDQDESDSQDHRESSAQPQQVSTIWTGDAREAGESLPESTHRLWDSVSAQMDVGFELASTTQGTPPSLRVRMLLRNGRIDHPQLPFDLHELFGTIIWDNDSLEIRDLQATHGSTQLLLQGKRVHAAASFSSEWHVQMTNLVVDQQFRGTLRGGLARLYDSLQPQGNFDLVFDLKELQPDSSVREDGSTIIETAGNDVENPISNSGPETTSEQPIVMDFETTDSSPIPTPAASIPRQWEVDNLLLTVKDAAITPTKFPYPITKMTGQIQQKERELTVSLSGLAGKRPIAAEGVIRDPGFDAGVDLTIQIDKIPLGESLLTAFPAKVQPTIESLRLTGTMEGAAHIVRPSGKNRIWSTFIEVDIRDGTMQYEKFPYRLVDLNGHLVYSSANDRWSATNVTAKRNNGIIQAEAHFNSPAHSHDLSLTLTGSQVPLDGNLQQALPDGLRKAWESIDLRGTADLSAVVLWNQGEKVELSLPSVEVTSGSMQLDKFRFPLEQIKSKFSYHQGVVQFQSFLGRHDETQVRAKGTMQLHDDGGWKLNLDPIYVDDLNPNRSFRRALSPELMQVVELVNPQHPLSMSGKVAFEQKMVEDVSAPMTATFDIETILTGNSMDAGIELKSLFGRVTSVGTWDGYQCEMLGAIDLESMLAHGYYITQVQGPYRWQNQQLVVGSQKMIDSLKATLPQNPVPLQERLSGKVIGGILTMDSVIDAGTPPPEESPGKYQVVLTLSDGKLETYAAQYLTEQKDLRGVVNAWMNLHGSTSDEESLRGRGQMQISPAALYELPVMVQILQLVRPGPTEKAAFQYVFLDFNVIHQRVEFSVIDLVGDTISLRGRGTATLDGKLDLDFYSTMTQNQLSIPVVSKLLGEATKGWVGVKVRGEVNHPEAEVQPLKNLDSALKHFLGAFDPTKTNPMPRFFAPPRPATPRASPVPPYPTTGPAIRPRSVNPRSATPGKPTSTN
ncbi:MAG: hypothetical protein ACKVT0_02075 [Planctomycetaceae bacterium]